MSTVGKDEQAAGAHRLFGYNPDEIVGRHAGSSHGPRHSLRIGFERDGSLLVSQDAAGSIKCWPAPSPSENSQNKGEV